MVVDDFDGSALIYAPERLQVLCIDDEGSLHLLAWKLLQFNEGELVPVEAEKVTNIPVAMRWEHRLCCGHELMHGKLRGDRVKIGVFVGQNEVHSGRIVADGGCIGQRAGKARDEKLEEKGGVDKFAPRVGV